MTYHANSYVKRPPAGKLLFHGVDPHARFRLIPVCEVSYEELDSRNIAIFKIKTINLTVEEGTFWTVPKGKVHE